MACWLITCIDTKSKASGIQFGLLGFDLSIFSVGLIVARNHPRSQLRSHQILSLQPAPLCKGHSPSGLCRDILGLRKNASLALDRA